jgi:hypothetical protein
VSARRKRTPSFDELEQEVERLRRERDRLRRDREQVERDTDRLREENARLERERDRLRREIERLTAALGAAQRAGRRQAAPFSKGAPTPRPQPPGRRAGSRHGRHGHRHPPSAIDDIVDVPLPPQLDGRVDGFQVQDSRNVSRTAETAEIVSGEPQ